MTMTRYVTESGTVVDGEWTPGGFREAGNAPDDEAAVRGVWSLLQSMGYTTDQGDHARVLDAEKREIARIKLDADFWTSHGDAPEGGAAPS